MKRFIAIVLATMVGCSSLQVAWADEIYNDDSLEVCNDEEEINESEKDEVVEQVDDDILIEQNQMSSFDLQLNDVPSLAAYTPYSYNISFVGASFSSLEGVSASEINAKTVSHISAHEGGYDAVNPNDNGSCSLGKLQWNANAGRALSLMRAIISKDNATAYNCLGDALYQEITASSTNWTGRKLNSNEAAAVKKLLGTQASKQIQDQLAQSDVNKYLNAGYTLGIRSAAALLYYADLANQYGSAGAKKHAAYGKNIAGNWSDMTLNDLHLGSVCYIYDNYYSNRYSGPYIPLRRSTYKYASGLGWKYCKSGDYKIPYDENGIAGAAWIQNALNTYQNAGLTVDGNYSESTKKAVKKFQTANGLTADGYAGVQTSSVLIYELYDSLAKTGQSTTPLPAITSSKWIKVGTKWWYRHGDGSYTRSSWENINNKWYYFDSEGWMTYGWQKIKNKWYYLGTANDGVMKTGWQKIGNKWYYFGSSSDGAMKSGWQNIGSNRYYLGTANDGAMKTGWQYIDDNWYYLGAANDGAMKTGWISLKGVYYYLYSDGKMASDTWIDNYYVDKSGKWTQSR